MKPNQSSAFKKNRFGYLIKDLVLQNIISGFTCREYNYSLRAGKNKSERRDILNARRVFFDSLNINMQNAVFLEQPHKDKVARIKARHKGRGVFDFKTSIPDCDAAITSEPDIALCVLTADCLPVILFESKAKVGAIVHVGWRGAQKNIIRKTIKLMIKDYRCMPQEISVYIGPGIRACCYQVGEDVRAQFPEDTRHTKGGFYLDLIKVIRRQLADCRVTKRKIFDSCICTSCRRKEFFSYRRGDRLERILSLIMIKTRVKR